MSAVDPDVPSRRRARRSALRIWAWPLVLGVLSLSGLLTALVSETWGDFWSWFSLGIPLAVMAWYGWLRPVSVSDLSNTGDSR